MTLDEFFSGRETPRRLFDALRGAVEEAGNRRRGAGLDQGSPGRSGVASRGTTPVRARGFSAAP